MPYCDCGTRIQTGSQCQQCRLDDLHEDGVVDDRHDDWIEGGETDD